MDDVDDDGCSSLDLIDHWLLVASAGDVVGALGIAVDGWHDGLLRTGQVLQCKFSCEVKQDD